MEEEVEDRKGLEEVCFYIHQYISKVLDCGEREMVLHFYRDIFCRLCVRFIMESTFPLFILFFFSSRFSSFRTYLSILASNLWRNKKRVVTSGHADDYQNVSDFIITFRIL